MESNKERVTSPEYLLVLPKFSASHHSDQQDTKKERTGGREGWRDGERMRNRAGYEERRDSGTKELML